MAVFVVAILSLILDVITYVPALNWFSVVGFCLGVSAWVMGRKVRKTDPGRKYAALSMGLGIVGTFAGLAGILIAFVAGSILVGGFVIF